MWLVVVLVLLLIPVSANDNDGDYSNDNISTGRHTDIIFYSKPGRFFICYLSTLSISTRKFSGQDPHFNRLSETENVALQMSCGTRPAMKAQESFVAHGVYSMKGEFPWAASLSAADMEDLYNRCGATIISPRHLLSATHCFFDYELKQIPCK